VNLSEFRDKPPPEKNSDGRRRRWREKRDVERF